MAICAGASPPAGLPAADRAGRPRPEAGTARRAASRPKPPAGMIEQAGDAAGDFLDVGRHPGSGVVQDRMGLLAGGHERAKGVHEFGLDRTGLDQADP